MQVSIFAKDSLWISKFFEKGFKNSENVFFKISDLSSKGEYLGMLLATFGALWCTYIHKLFKKGHENIKISFWNPTEAYHSCWDQAFHKNYSFKNEM